MLTSAYSTEHSATCAKLNVNQALPWFKCWSNVDRPSLYRGHCAHASERPKSSAWELSSTIKKLN